MAASTTTTTTVEYSLDGFAKFLGEKLYGKEVKIEYVMVEKGDDRFGPTWKEVGKVRVSMEGWPERPVN